MPRVVVLLVLLAVASACADAARDVRAPMDVVTEPAIAVDDASASVAEIVDAHAQSAQVGRCREVTRPRSTVSQALHDVASALDVPQETRHAIAALLPDVVRAAIWRR